MAKPLTLFCLHFLGGSAREFQGVAGWLDKSSLLIGIDLPGFGRARDLEGYSVAEMAATVATRIRKIAATHWMLVGHSMGAKVAAVVAKEAENGAEGLGGLAGLLLLAGSPLGPEPMEESKRDAMLGWFRGERATSRREAEIYVKENVASPLAPQTAELAVDDVLHAHPAAWRAWLTSGSREDWTRKIGVLRTPTLIVAGADDTGLGEDAQRQHVLPHYSNATLRTLAKTGHLLPLERPEAVADLIKEHGEACERRL